MKINWKLRLCNKTTLTALIASAISLVYIVLGIFDIVPGVTQNQLTDLAAAALNVLVLLGVVVDPTTDGVSDSERALQYAQPALNANETADTGGL